MKITIEIADVNALSADGRLALLTLMQIRTNERPAERVARQVAASPGVPIAADDVPSAGQVPVPDRMPAAAPAVTVEQPAAVDTAKLFGGQTLQPAASAPSVPAIPPVPSVGAPAVPANASASPPVPLAAAAAPSDGGSVAAPPAPTNALDKRGLPWDIRIHASTKRLNEDGSWRQKRGVDPAEVERVEQSLRELVAIPAVAQPIPQVVPPGGVVPPVSVVPPMTYQALMTKAIEWTSAVPQAISMPEIFNALQTIGVKMLPDLQHRPDLVQPAHDAIVARMAQLQGG